MDEGSDPGENLSPIIVPKKKRRTFRPTLRSKSHLLPNESVPPLIENNGQLSIHNEELPPLHIEESNVIAPPEAEDETSLFFMLKNKRFAVKNIVEDWIKFYEIDKEKAILKLIQLILNASGKRGRVTPQIMHIENCDTVIEMPTDAETKKGIYPIVRNGRVWKLFNTNYVNFMQTLVKSCEDSIVHDEFLINNLFSCLNVFKNCLWRPLRHVAMLTVLKLTTALIDIILNIIETTDDSQLQIYDCTINENTEKFTKIKSMIQFVLNEVLPLSHRDRFSTIRILTISELYEWMEKIPNFFIEDNYLNFISINLNDNLYAVRSKCIEILQSLYEQPEYKPFLVNFTEKTKTQISNMLSDRKPEIVIQVIKLLKTMVSQKYALQNTDINNIYALVYDSHPGVGRVAGEFLDMKIMNTINNEPRKAMSKRYINYVVKFSMQLEFEERNYLLIDSLLKCTSYIKNWESYIELLLEGFDSDSESPYDDEELVLIDLMVCCVEQITTGISPRDMKGANQKIDCSSWKKSDDRSNMTVLFIQNLSVILNKCLPSIEKISRLVKIPKFFDIDEQIFIREEENIIALIGDLRNIIATYPESEILNNFVSTLTTISEINDSLQNECNAMQLCTIFECMKKFVSIINEHDQDITTSRNTESQNSENSKHLTNALLIISIFFEYHNLNKCDVMDKIFPFIQLCLEESSYVHMAFVYALRCSYFSIIWDVTNLLQTPSDQNTEFINELQNQFKKYIELYESVITYSPIPRARVEAFYVLCNLLMFQSSSFLKLADNPNLNTLMDKPTLSTCRAMNLFVQTTVFINEDEETDEKREQKRNILISYCKLITFNIISAKKAIDIIQHYNIWYNEYGSIIKYTMNIIFNRNKNNAFKIINICLRKMFLRMKEIFGEVKTSKNAYLQLKDLAKNLALLFPFNNSTREYVRKLHKSGISFSFEGWDRSANESTEVSIVLSPPPNLHFLGILNEFVKKLPQKDKKHVVKYLERIVQNDLKRLKGNDWLSFTKYRAQLLRKN